MKFYLGVVGHQDTVQMVTDLVKEYFDRIEVVGEEFGTDEIIADAVKRIARLQTHCDGILYSRRDPYLLISERLQHTIPVSYVETDTSHLLISLLKAMIHYKIEPRRISIDGLDRLSIMEALKNVGISEDLVTIDIVSSELKQDDLVNATLAQHLKNWTDGAELCITNITTVCRSLRAQGVPCTVIDPTAKFFLHEIRNLMLRCQLRNQKAGPLAIMHIRLDYKEKYRFYDQMPIREIDELSNASRLIAVFAEKIDGALFTLGRWEHLLLCDCGLLQDATDQFMDFDLMKSINLTTAFNVVIGIGCGFTITEAKKNATIAVNQARAQRGTNTFVALSAERLIGPLRPKNERFTVESDLDLGLTKMAKTTGLSLPVLNKLFQATLKQNSNLFTTKQLAEVLEVSTRTTNRIIERLLDHHYASIEGKNLAQTRGRPARVIRLFFRL